MKRVVLFFATWVISLGALAFTPDQYANQVLQKDLPRSLRWFAQLVEAQQVSQAEVYNLYQSALPETQVNQQLGISVKGSVDRMVLFLEGARYFEQVQRAPLEYQNKKESLMRILQAAKDQMDRFQYGEDPQVLLDEWKNLGVIDLGTFTADLVEVFTETQRLLNTPAMAPVEARVDAEKLTPVDETVAGVEIVETQVENDERVAPEPSKDAASVAPEPESASESKMDPEPEPVLESGPGSFEMQRFNSYVQSAEVGRVAGECQNAVLWKTDQAASCQSDDSLECDRSYARQCKKLQ